MNGPGSADSSRDLAPSDLEGIRAAIAASNPELYRHLALYLQVLRSVLAERVHQACFHLATQVHASRYLRLAQRERLALHKRRHELVRRCCSLLTVEQLEALARQMVRENLQRQSGREQQLLARLIRQAEAGTASGSGESDRSEAETGPSDLPPGSIRLDLTPPLQGGTFAWSDAGFEAINPFAEDPDNDQESPDPSEAEFWETSDEDDAAVDASERRSDDDPLPWSTAADASEDHAAGSGAPTPVRDGADAAPLTASGNSGDDDPADAEITAIFAAAAAASKAMAQRPPQLLVADSPPGSPSRKGIRRDDSAAAPGRDAADAPSAQGRSGSASPEQVPLPYPWNRTGLPDDPIHLIEWLDGLEKALGRRLRNLSHAINVDLLRFGLSRGLLPLNLLEAVLQGQIETMASPANVLRLQLPFGLRPGAPPLQALAILLRQADLEMEEPRLRTCRRRLHQHRQEVRRMAQQYRRLQRRQQAHEAERLWLQDIRRSLPPQT